jgi:hypothetical protein
MKLKMMGLLTVASAALLTVVPLPTPFDAASALVQNSGQCGFIQNSDRRAMCRARAEGNVGQCGFIQDNDLRAMCRAEVGNNPGQCGFIQDADMRAECRAKLS